MIANRYHLLFLLLSILILGSQRAPGQSLRSPGIQWMLRSFDYDDGGRKPITSRNPSIEFSNALDIEGADPDWRRSYGSSGCNGWDGIYRLRNTDSIDHIFEGTQLVYC